MDKELKAHIEYLLCIKIQEIQVVSGGDISEAYLLKTESERFFCKVNHAENAYQMFLAEKSGLEAISKTKTIATPKVLLCEPLETGGFLLMDYIESKSPSSKDMESFGHQLAALHELSSSKTFGWDSDNFIGNLYQSNQEHLRWVDFYVQERLVPQIQLARNAHKLSKSETPSKTQLLKNCELLFPDTKPSLLHGDLWSSNYLIAKSGVPYLIDPSVYFGHHEVDIAMTRLFGGFDTSFYESYKESFPEIGNEKERSDLYQLYYLLVHLNLFGSSYKTSVTQILTTYF